MNFIKRLAGSLSNYIWHFNTSLACIAAVHQASSGPSLTRLICSAVAQRLTKSRIWKVINVYVTAPMRCQFIHFAQIAFNFVFLLCLCTFISNEFLHTSNLLTFPNAMKNHTYHSMRELQCKGSRSTLMSAPHHGKPNLSLSTLEIRALYIKIRSYSFSSKEVACN